MTQNLGKGFSGKGVGGLEGYFLRLESNFPTPNSFRWLYRAFAPYRA